MNFLVLGASGMAGHMVSLYLEECGHTVTRFDKKRIPVIKSIVSDVRDLEGVKAHILAGNYDSVVNCIGVLNQFAEQNKELAILLNSYFPNFLASVTLTTNIQIIHLSTDCVFSGNRGSYTEEDIPDGTTLYDRTKALGELNDKKNITLRTSIIGPDINEDGIGLLNWFMKQEGSIKGFTKAMWTGVTSLQLAKVIEAAAKNKIHGLYNMVHEKPISKYELIRLLNHHLRKDSMKIVPSESIISDKSLLRTKFEFDYIIPDYETMIFDLADWIRRHKDLYSHYKLL